MIFIGTQRRDSAEAPPKYPTKPIEKVQLPPIYGNQKDKLKQP